MVLNITHLVFFTIYRTVLHITEMVICMMVLHIRHFGVFCHLQDSPAYNRSGYM